MLPMEALFSSNEEDRSSFLSFLVQYFDCTYICLWSFEFSYLTFRCGFYREDNTSQPSSSSGMTLARRCFDEYQRIFFSIANEFVPGLAFKNNCPYLQLNALDLRNMASVEVQRRFYHEAKIETAVFLGCGSGEIEIGWSNAPQIDLENKMRAWFLDDLSCKSPLISQASEHPISQFPSSSSFTSLSMMGSLDGSSIASPFSSSRTLASRTSTTTSAFDQVPLHQTIQLPGREHEEAVMTSAILAVLSSSSISSSSTRPNRSAGSAFSSYMSGSAAASRPEGRLRRKSMVNRAITYYKGLHIVRRERMFLSRHHLMTSTRLDHIMYERKRRKMLNESFQALRALLPRQIQKGQVRVLTGAREELISLKEQVRALTSQNQVLEAQLPPTNETELFTTERIHVMVTHVPESTSRQRFIDLQVVVRGENSISQMVARILEFLKQVEDVTVKSIGAYACSNTQSTTTFNRVLLRLAIKENDWDESALREAIKRIVCDYAK